MVRQAWNHPSCSKEEKQEKRKTNSVPNKSKASQGESPSILSHMNNILWFNVLLTRLTGVAALPPQFGRVPPFGSWTLPTWHLPVRTGVVTAGDQGPQG